MEEDWRAVLERVSADEVELDVDGCVLYNGEAFTGEMYDTAPNGQMTSLTSYFKGFEDGPTQEWYENGQKQLEGQSKFGAVAVGVWRQWHPNGQLALEQEFDDKGNELSRTKWDATGKLLS